MGLGAVKANMWVTRNLLLAQGMQISSKIKVNPFQCFTTSQMAMMAARQC